MTAIFPGFEVAMREIVPGMFLFRERAGDDVLDTALALIATHPPRRMDTPMGKMMSAAITNCGPLGWISDRTGYRYSAIDPETSSAWPQMPPVFQALAVETAAQAGFADFEPDACLINFYEAGARMGAHQDRDEQDFTQPIVSVSLGASAVFKIGGEKRRDPVTSIRLHHGDVLVFGGPARLRFHGIDRIFGDHARLGAARLNLTFRRAR